MCKDKRPRCTRCGSRTGLARVSPVQSIELRIYECSSCGQTDCYEVTAEPGAPWILLTGERLTEILSAWKRSNKEEGQ
ncbi:hypothetical protein BJ123_1202 [Rhodopseudomonas thermotolerans]|uniref:Uncharacterized protein n=2 Tax=Rhodopseudomonas TaxID=1073 RepID=A0A336JS92_9BRAD|nr:hypothetical protein BJ125_1202 [Rhodopseudomonas pentothenatexigens]REF92243.1 hypothetical protein BJ123_1202 [Rhodopseudomonas thermotolerans]SSW92418.1 hypothetical protein SAMN05892882_1202 [Rhodopseudomonas pentothenatexigens]